MNGFLIVNKGAGMSSYDVIRRLKKLSPFQKIGYIGTLDRNATGVLPVAINEGVKLIPFFENEIKAYRAKILLGVTTDTFDIEGRVLTTVTPDKFEKETIEALLGRFKGKITQQVPIYSSKKIHRKPMYKLARKGIAIDPHQKEVEIFSIELLDYSHPHIDIEVVCSKGTYIRALANDLGGMLGCGATLFSLKRTQHGEFTQEMSTDIETFNSKDDILNSLISLENVLKSFNGILVLEAIERFMKNGMPIPLLGNSRGWKDGETTKLLNNKGTLIGIGMTDLASKTIKIKRLINN
ncbi:MAG: tRNA pseudouridine(55) synthase TruB [Proteobacteria bacterium]|nr:tRNA pseudouridine(55) synthase TruB [Pseudomonadota bacterium]